MSRDVSLEDRIMLIKTCVSRHPKYEKKLQEKKFVDLSLHGFEEIFFPFLNNDSRVITGNSILLMAKPFDPAKFLGKDWTEWKKSSYDNGDDIDPHSLLTKTELASFICETCTPATEKPITEDVRRKEEFRYQEKEFLDILYFTSNIFYYLWSDHQVNKGNSVLEWLWENFKVFSIDLRSEILPYDWYRFGQRGFYIRFDSDPLNQIKLNLRRFRIDLVDAFPNAGRQDKLDRRVFNFSLVRDCTGSWSWHYYFALRSQWLFQQFSTGNVDISSLTIPKSE